MDEREIEQVLRTGLERHAAEADVTAPVAARVRTEVGRRRRTRWGSVAAAAAVVLVAGGVAVATQGGPRDSKEPPVVTDPTADDAPPVDGDRRTEYWQGIAVDIPADWGYGGAPAESGSEVVACFPEAYVGPDGSHLSRPGERGWVGRPITMTDVCARYPWIENSPQEEPTQPYVWLGAAVEPGVVEYANGYVQETVEVDGVPVTVASDDAGLREEILGSARPSEDTLCEPSLRWFPRAGTSVIDVEDPSPEPYAWVCAYRRTDDGRFGLSYAAQVDPSAAEAAIEAQQAAPDQRVDCDYEPVEFVVLKDGVSGSTDRVTVYETGCADGTVHLGGGVSKQMVAAGVDPWARSGIRAALSYFIGPQG
ncbi:hypothetical protein D0Z08_11845 [Nocardioides immobilis]|uniref:Uncharacterized protein n=1 Tax=Nocardioides immobilis TaxID=2049295 RepID=A0A417Y2R7_9ACTN|nr:hypothetical protein [Nocardioides immobilis]RHW26881.1 hypothetical protein D0Z08_11845 [Nocardioides immobilis]